MSIYQTPTGWKIKVMRNGHRYTDFVKGLENHQKAVAMEAKAKADFALGLKPEATASRGFKGLTLAYAFERTFNDVWVHVSKGMQTNVIRYEADLYKVFKPSADISTIDKAALVAYVSFLKDKGNQPKTINNKLSFVSTMLKHMQDIGKLEVVPSIKWESVVRNGRVRWFTVKEEQALYDIALSRNPLGNDINVLLKDFMCLLFDTGMRPWAEAFNIQRSWVRTDDEGTLFIRVPVEYSKTKTAREIPATKRVTKLLEKYTEGLAPTDRLFRNLTRTYCRRYWDNAVKPTMGWGDDEVVYCVRHTFATRLIEKGADTRVIQELLGHSTIGQTARYAKVTKGAKTSSVALLN